MSPCTLRNDTKSTPCYLQIFPFSASPSCLAISTTTPILRTFQSEGPVSNSHSLLRRATRPIARRAFNRARQALLLPPKNGLSDLSTQAVCGCYARNDDSIWLDSGGDFPQVRRVLEGSGFWSLEAVWRLSRVCDVISFPPWSVGAPSNSESSEQVMVVGSAGVEQSGQKL